MLLSKHTIQAIANHMKNNYHYDYQTMVGNQMIFQIHLTKFLKPCAFSDNVYRFTSYCKVEPHECLEQTKFIFEYIVENQMASLKSIEFMNIKRSDFLRLEKDFLNIVKSIVFKRNNK